MAKFISLANLRRFMSYIDEALILVQNDYRSRIEGSVRFDTPQSLTDAQKAQVKTNIGAGGIEEAPNDGKSYLRKDKDWTPLEAGLSEKVVLHITTDEGSLSSSTVTVKDKSDGSTIHTLSWTGQDISFFVRDGINYEVSFSNEDGFSAPAPIEFTAIADTQRNITATYQISRNGIFIGYTDGSTSPYDQLVSGKIPEGVVVKTDDMCILLHPAEGSSKQWSSNTSTQISGVTTATSSSTAKQDFAGKANTAAVVASGLAGSAFTFATALGSDWYLPACGEMEQIRLNEANINTALGLIGGTQLAFSGRYYWSSTQYSSIDAWYWDIGTSIWNYYAKIGDTYCRAVRAF